MLWIQSGKFKWAYAMAGLIPRTSTASINALLLVRCHAALNQLMVIFILEKQGRIHGYPSCVRVGSGNNLRSVEHLGRIFLLGNLFIQTAITSLFLDE